MTSSTAPIFSDPTYTGATQSSATSTKSNSTIDQNQFLNLLMTQLKNQDPMNPMDDKDFTAQLATFSNLEQMTNMNKSMTSLLTQQQQLNTTAAAGMIGLEVTGKDGTAGVVSGVKVDADGTHLMIGKTILDLTNVTQISPQTAQ